MFVCVLLHFRVFFIVSVVFVLMFFNYCLLFFDYTWINKGLLSSADIVINLLFVVAFKTSKSNFYKIKFYSSRNIYMV